MIKRNIIESLKSNYIRINIYSKKKIGFVNGKWKCLFSFNP